MSNFETFHYPFRSYDLTEMSDETRDLLNVRDNNLENYLNGLDGVFVRQTDIRYGSTVVTLPAVNGGVTITYSSLAAGEVNNRSAFSSTLGFSAYLGVISNGDPPANTAPYVVWGATFGQTGFTAYRISGGATSEAARINFIGYAF